MPIGLILALFAAPALMFAQEQAPERDKGDLNSGARSAASPVAVPPALLPPLTARQKVARRTLGLVDPVTLFSSAFSAGFGQLRDKPPEWGQGAEGYGRRYANAEGFTAVRNGVALPFDLAFHLDPRYRRIPQGRFLPRLRSAVTQTFVANKDSGGTMINVPVIAGSFGAGLIANSWEPAQSSSVGKGLTRGALAIGYHTLKNITREFLPDILHRGR